MTRQTFLLIKFRRTSADSVRVWCNHWASDQFETISASGFEQMRYWLGRLSIPVQESSDED